MAGKVFLSYSSADKDIADRVCSALEATGISCWIAPRDIEPGVDYPAAIVDAINSCQVLVLILTKHAAASPHVLSEVGHAFNGKKQIIPFRLTSEPPPESLEYFLSMTQWLDASDGCTEQNLKRLTEAISDPLAGSAARGVTHTGERHTRLIVGVISVLVLAFGMIVYWRSQRSHGSGGAPVPPEAHPPIRNRRFGSTLSMGKSTCGSPRERSRWVVHQGTASARTMRNQRIQSPSKLVSGSDKPK